MIDISILWQQLTVACLLKEFKLTDSELGGLGIFIALVSDLVNSIFTNISKSFYIIKAIKFIVIVVIIMFSKFVTTRIPPILYKGSHLWCGFIGSCDHMQRDSRTSYLQ